MAPPQVWGGGIAPLQKIFRTPSLKTLHFRAFYVLLIQRHWVIPLPRQPPLKTGSWEKSVTTGPQDPNPSVATSLIGLILQTIWPLNVFTCAQRLFFSAQSVFKRTYYRIVLYGQVCLYTLCFKNVVSNFFCNKLIKLLTNFEKFFHCWKQQWIVYKINKHFSPFFKNLVALSCETWNLKKNVASALPILDDKAVNCRTFDTKLCRT